MSLSQSGLAHWSLAVLSEPGNPWFWSTKTMMPEGPHSFWLRNCCTSAKVPIPLLYRSGRWLSFLWFSWVHTWCLFFTLVTKERKGGGKARYKEVPLLVSCEVFFLGKNTKCRKVAYSSSVSVVPFLLCLQNLVSRSVVVRAGEMAQRSRTLTALPKVLSSIPSNQMVSHNHP